MANNSLQFTHAMDLDPSMRVCVLIDVTALRAQISRSLNINNFTVDFGSMIRSIADKLGPITNVDFYLSTYDVNKMEILHKFARYVEALGANAHICTQVRNEFISNDDPNAKHLLDGAPSADIGAVDNGWIIRGGGRPKVTAKLEMAAAIAAAACSGRYDCIVLGTNDSIFIPVIRRYILARSINCGVIFIQNEERPEPNAWTLGMEFLNLFHYRLRFTDKILTIRDES